MAALEHIIRAPPAVISGCANRLRARISSCSQSRSEIRAATSQACAQRNIHVPKVRKSRMNTVEGTGDDP
ncbi:hypothetical protein MAHJHV50_44250 [Mycobacterium avium subsp. hominissuis]